MYKMKYLVCSLYLVKVKLFKVKHLTDQMNCVVLLLKFTKQSSIKKSQPDVTTHVKGKRPLVENTAAAM